MMMSLFIDMEKQATLRWLHSGNSIFIKKERYMRLFFLSYRKEPNQALLPTAMSVTDRADARSAPDTAAADL
jgi:hypothetical protein